MSIRKLNRSSQPQHTSLGREAGFFWSAARNSTKVGIAGSIYDSTNILDLGSLPFVNLKNFSVIAIYGAPTPNSPSGELIRLGGASGGIRLESYTSAGGIYLSWIATTVGNLPSSVFGVTSFSTCPIVAISSWSSTNVTAWAAPSYPYSTIDRPVQTLTQALSMATTSDTSLKISGGPGRNIYGIVVLPRRIGDTEARQIIQNPWQLFTQATQAPIFVPYATATIVPAPETPGYRPTSDVLTTGWTATPGPAFATSVDELSPDNADFITSSSVGLDPIIMGLNQNLPVGVWEVKVNASYTNGARQIRAVLLDETNAVTGTSNWVSVPSISYTQLTLPVTTTALSSRIRIEVQ